MTSLFLYFIYQGLVHEHEFEKFHHQVLFVIVFMSQYLLLFNFSHGTSFTLLFQNNK